ncbi:M3 family metallopeptidase [Coprobacter tertius]|uniref:M3 family metallopeptidase n=1 Tax=Coprobacter tertius TaxID=2944915 RepID=A0ABT1MIH2_9BACT|nr:M3 family metallopeptidase [Coprobacter tertius]MCP9612422.1 M3 family metallopeptidase [Coprobacter tertius]
MRNLLFITTCIMIITACVSKKETNPFLSEFQTPFGVPPFEQIDTSDYKPAILQGIEQQNQEIKAIISNPETPDFKNTIESLDYSGEILSRVLPVFYGLADAETNPTLQRLVQEMSPILSEHEDNIYLNDSLFARIKKVYDNRENMNLDGEQIRVLDKYYRKFVRSGALLSDSDKIELRDINKKLALLSIQFGDNVLAENNAFELVIDNENDLAGIPQNARTAAAEEAAARGKSGKWVFTLDEPSRIPFLQYAENRDLREKIYKAYINRSDNDNKYDNKKIVSDIINLRTRKAHLLGFDSYADFVLDDRMAKNTANVTQLMNRVWSCALPKAKAEAAELQKMIDKEGGNFKLAAWDWWYYTEKLRQDQYNLNESELKPYFKLDNVREGAFMVANKLYGITFTELKDMPVYHPDIKVYEVKDADGKHLAVFYTDYFPRPGKRGGAWMSAFREEYIKDGKEIRPVIYNVCNFTKPTADSPSLLTLDEVETLFHEFGHALHGMLTQCTYPSVSGTNVMQDFVELPSQVMEHWATHPEVLKLYAKNYKTGEAIPDSLIAKIEKVATFNQGFETTEFLAAGILDMKWHEVNKEQNFDVRAFEKAAVNEMGLIDEIGLRYRSTYFSHIFSGEYAVGYYSYLWAQVLDADAFEAFVEKGIFDQPTAKAFRSNVLEKGDSEDPMKLYIQFRGAEPNPESLLKIRGLK